MYMKKLILWIFIACSILTAAAMTGNYHAPSISMMGNKNHVLSQNMVQMNDKPQKNDKEKNDKTQKGDKDKKDKEKGDKEKKTPTKYAYHRVKEGESLYSISKIYHTEIDDIAKLNPGSKERIWPGATLRVPDMREGEEGEVDEAEDSLHIKDHLEEFIGQIYKIAAIQVDNMEDIKAVDKKINSLDTKWNVYYNAKQANIADNDAMMELVSQYQQIKQDTKDSLDTYKNHLVQIQNFNKADKFITSQMAVYQKMADQAQKLSLADALAPKLEDLKAKEQVIFADIEKNYELAKTAAAQNTYLTKRMDQITNNYIELKKYSEQIQAAEYKPFIERIKDYLIGLAAVAILLMFINMVQAKIKAYKQMKESAKQLEKYRMQNDTEHPSI